MYQHRSPLVAPQVGLEPTTLRLTAECSAIELLRNKFRQRPSLPGRVQPSTFGAKRLNFCVRNGNRWDPLAIATGKDMLFSRTLKTTQRFLAIPGFFRSPRSLASQPWFLPSQFFASARSSLASAPLDQALDRLVSTTFTHCCASSVDLSPHRL